MPHEHNAQFYDFVYQQSFGQFYDQLTSHTIEQISNILVNGSVIDYGAGTGRLSIPLSQQGYQITSVEQSPEMAEILMQNRDLNGLDFNVHNKSIAQFSGEPADLALSIFTVLSYILTEDEMNSTIKNVSKHLNENGFFFFDLPNTVFFNQNFIINIDRENFRRLVTLEPALEQNIYVYHEECSGIFNNEEFDYVENFNIRYWDHDVMNELLEQNQLHNTNRNFPMFNGTGSTYRLYQKR